MRLCTPHTLRPVPAYSLACTPSHKFVQDAVCFDVDCTITVNDTLDLLAEFMGVGEEVAALTHKARPQRINKSHVCLLKQLRGRLVRGRTASTACRSVYPC